VDSNRVVAGPAHLFSFAKADARVIFDGFNDEQPVEITLQMLNGDVKQVLLPNIPPGYFAVYSAMLQTCVNENRD
jgi:hypothetical protein